MVVFEILSSHYHMSRWHEERIVQHTGDMEALHSAGLSLRERIDTLVQEQGTSPTAAESPVRSERAGAGTCRVIALQILFYTLYPLSQLAHVCVPVPVWLNCVFMYCQEPCDSRVQKASFAEKHMEYGGVGLMGYCAEKGVMCCAGASANGSEAFVQPEEDEEDAEGGIAAVVERSLQRAVKSKAHGELLRVMLCS